MKNKKENSIRVSIIIPCYNEEQGLLKTLKDIYKNLEFIDHYEIIAINDGSTDGTRKILVNSKASYDSLEIIENEKNLGYGASLKKGIRKARGEIIVITDADATYPASDIKKLIKHLDNCDMAVGARLGNSVNIPWVRRPAKWILLKYAKWMSKADIKDLNSGLRAFRKEDSLRFFHLFPDGFSFTSTITLAMHINGFNVKYIPINYHKRLGNSSIRPIHDTLAFFSLVLRTTMYFRPFQVFGSLSCFFLFSAIATGVIGKLITNKVPDVATVSLISTSLIFFGLGLIGDLVNVSSKSANK